MPGKRTLAGQVNTKQASITDFKIDNSPPTVEDPTVFALDGRKYLLFSFGASDSGSGCDSDSFKLYYTTMTNSAFNQASTKYDVGDGYYLVYFTDATSVSKVKWRVSDLLGNQAESNAVSIINKKSQPFSIEVKADSGLPKILRR